MLQMNLGIIMHSIKYMDHISVPPGFCDSAIAEFIVKSSKLRNFRKITKIFTIAADFA